MSLPPSTSLPPRNHIIIGLSGVSSGGKTSLATALREELSAEAVVETLRLDQYFLEDKDRLPFITEIQHTDYEQPCCINYERYYADATAIVERFTSNPQARAGEQLLILDGFLLFNEPRLLALCHLKYDFTLPYHVAKHRRQCRFYKNPDKPGYFDRAVWPGYIKYRRAVDAVGCGSHIVTIDGTRHRDKIFQEVYADLQHAARLCEQGDQ